MGNTPHTSTSRPPDVIHVIGVPRPSPFFTPLSCIILNENRRTKKWGRPGNEARDFLCTTTYMYALALAEIFTGHDTEYPV